MSTQREQTHAIILRRYLITWLALLGLLLLTLGSALLDLGVMNLVLNLGFAGAKALLVLAVFMHLYDARPVMRLTATVGFVWLGLLLLLTLSDYLTR